MSPLSPRDTYLRMSTHGSHGAIDVYSPRTFNRGDAQLAADAWVQSEFGTDHYTEFDRVYYVKSGLVTFHIRCTKPMSLGYDRTRLKVTL